MDSKIIERLLEIYRISRPLLLVLMLAAVIVFINSYPNVPEIAEATKDYRQQVKSKIDLNDTEKQKLKIESPESPSIPNTITPFISPEDVNEIANPKPKPKPKPEPTDDGGETPDSVDTEEKQQEPPLEIKLLTGFLNVAPLILVATVGGFGIYLLFKYKKHFTLRTMFGLAIALVSICTIIFLAIITFNFAEFLYNIDLDLNLVALGFLPIAIILGVWLSYNIISRNTTVFKRNIGLAFAGALMGAFLAAFLPFWIVFILLIAIALFDIYSVRFGPIKKIMELEEREKKSNNQIIKEKAVEKQIIYRKIADDSSPNKVILDKMEKANDKKDLSPNVKGTQKSMVKTKLLKKHDDEFDLMLMFDNPDWSLGLGDFVIYSMFTSAVLTYCMLYLPYYIFYSPALGLLLPWVIFIVCVLGLLVGFFITLKLLEKRSYLPGLPISIGFGFIVFVFCIFTLQIVNYLLYSEFVIIF